MNCKILTFLLLFYFLTIFPIFYLISLYSKSVYSKISKLAEYFIASIFEFLVLSTKVLINKHKSENYEQLFNLFANMTQFVLSHNHSCLEHTHEFRGQTLKSSLVI